jgi:hypothetical protein
MAIRDTFAAALDRLIEQVKMDRSILAAILCGSLAHDTVWEKSDIDLLLITIDDRLVKASDIALNADGVNIHALLVPRADFRRTIEGTARNSFVHSLVAKGRLLYTHDRTIADLLTNIADIGARDTAFQRMRAATGALPAIDKAHKWFVTRGDLDYTALWILYAATPLARVEVLGAGLLADREVIAHALRLNPSFFTVVYTNMLNAPKTTASVRAALDALDAYVAERAPELFAPVIEYLRDAGEMRSATEIDTYFTRTFDIGGVTTVCEYLADRRLIVKASTSARLTRKSTVDVQELAFFVAS